MYTCITPAYAYAIVWRECVLQYEYNWVPSLFRRIYLLQCLWCVCGVSGYLLYPSRRCFQVEELKLRSHTSHRNSWLCGWLNDRYITWKKIMYFKPQPCAGAAEWLVATRKEKPLHMLPRFRIQISSHLNSTSFVSDRPRVAPGHCSLRGITILEYSCSLTQNFMLLIEAVCRLQYYRFWKVSTEYIPVDIFERVL